MPGEAERVIAGGSSDHAALALIGRELQQGIARAAFLEAACALEIFEFAINVHPRRFGQRDGGRARGLNYCARDALSGRFDVSELHRHERRKHRGDGNVNRSYMDCAGRAKRRRRFGFGTRTPFDNNR